MILTFIIVVPILGIMLWIFFRTSPATNNAQRLRLVNAFIVVLAILGSIAVTLWVRFSMAGTGDAPWWPVISFLYCAVLAPSVIVLGGLIRNFVIFRSR